MLRKAPTKKVANPRQTHIGREATTANISHQLRRGFHTSIAAKEPCRYDGPPPSESKPAYAQENEQVKKENLDLTEKLKAMEKELCSARSLLTRGVFAPSDTPAIYQELKKQRQHREEEHGIEMKALQSIIENANKTTEELQKEINELYTKLSNIQVQIKEKTEEVRKAEEARRLATAELDQLCKVDTNSIDFLDRTKTPFISFGH